MEVIIRTKAADYKLSDCNKEQLVEAFMEISDILIRRYRRGGGK